VTVARFYANENLPEPVVVELRRLGHDILTIRESGDANRAVPDREVLDFATGNDRAMTVLIERIEEGPIDTSTWITARMALDEVPSGSRRFWAAPAR
jgi:hypothetical protein